MRRWNEANQVHYRKFRRATVQEALRAVREELGPSALVLSTQMVRSRGPRGWMGAREVEVAASIDRDETRDVTRDETRELSTPRITRTADRRTVRERGMAARLTASGLDAALADSIVQHPTLQRSDAGGRALREAVADTLRPLTAAQDELAPVEVFIGPPGAGKTTTIAKIAAQARSDKSSRLWLVAADGFRVGAVEQLRLYAEIIGSPFLVARSGQELSLTLDGLRRPLLVDTAGRSPRDSGNADILEALAGRPGVRRHLVLPATSSPSQALRILERFQPTQPDRVVLTRLDETETVAPLIGVLQGCKLPVSYLTHGQNVPDDLQRATPAALTEWVLGDSVAGACA